MKDGLEREVLQELIDSSYELVDDTMEFEALEAEGVAGIDLKNERATLKRRQEDLARRFQELADKLVKAGAFDTKEEARKFITPNPEDRMHVLGPNGVVPDDGTLGPEEEVDGLLSLFEGRDYFFRVPVAYNLHGTGIVSKWSAPNLEVQICAGPPPEHYSKNSLCENSLHVPETDPRKYIWVNGRYHGRNFQRVRQLVEMLCLEVQGAMVALGIAAFWKTNLISPPAMEIGSGEHFNRSVYVNSMALSLAFGVRFSGYSMPEGDLEEKIGTEGVLRRRTRQFERLFSSSDARARDIRQALRMYLRAKAAWSHGETAMFLGTMLEGLLLDRRKDDLSARLQDAVAFWIGSSATEREKIRKDIRDLYSARSDFVHNGELNPKGFREETHFHHAKRVVQKEIENL